MLSGFLALSLNLNAQNPKVHLIERTTFTACGECPCLDSIIYTCIVPSLQKSVVLQYHTEMSELYSADCDSITNWIVRDGSELRTNRDGRYYNYQFFKNIHQVCDSTLKYLQNDTVATVRITPKSKTYDPATRILNLSADFTPYLTDLTGTYMLNVVITENKLIAVQSHQDTCGTPFGHGGKYPVPHNDVTRNLAYKPFGDVLVSGNWLKSQTINRTLSMKLDSNLIASNCNIIIYVYLQADSLLKSVVQQALKQSLVWPLGEGQRPEIPSGEIRIVPNPAGSTANAQINIPESGNADFQLLDLSGRIIKHIASAYIENGSYNVPMQLGSVSNGQYLFQVIINGHSYTRVFTVLKK